MSTLRSGLLSGFHPGFARRTQILNAAGRCFQREGLHATTMPDVIQASGLSTGAVYSCIIPGALLFQITEAMVRFSARDGFDLTLFGTTWQTPPKDGNGLE